MHNNGGGAKNVNKKRGGGGAGEEGMGLFLNPLIARHLGVHSQSND